MHGKIIIAAALVLSLGLLLRVFSTAGRAQSVGQANANLSKTGQRLAREVTKSTATASVRVDTVEACGVTDPDEGTVTLANVQVAMGTTRRATRVRLMRAFNTPFFPGILVCSEVMGEGVDLQRFCRHVVHHDLAWNPSTIEQRTGRIDRLGCKAEGRQPIVVYLPYLAGTAPGSGEAIMES